MPEDIIVDSKNEANDKSVIADRSAKPTKVKPMIGLDADILGDVEVKLTATLGEGSLKVSELLELGEGSVVNLNTHLNGQVDLVLNEKLIAKGEIVAVGDHFGVRITHFLASKK